jgi:hypothetical protein
MKLKHDKYSHVKPKVIYGRHGEKVKLISRRDHVLIVQGESGQRFAINEDEITNNEVAPKTEPVNNFSKPVPAAKPKGNSKPGHNQNTLF